MDDVPRDPRRSPPKGRSLTARSICAPYGRGTWAESSDGRPAVHRQRVVAQDPGVVLEEAERAEPGGRDVAVRVDQHEQPVVLEHEGVLGEALVGAVDPGVADRLLHRDRSEALGSVARGPGVTGAATVPLMPR